MRQEEEAAQDRDLAAQVQALMTDEERRIFEMKETEGLEWAEIAARLGGTAEGIRQKYNRARKRIRKQLGQEEQGDD